MAEAKTTAATKTRRISAAKTVETKETPLVEAVAKDSGTEITEHEKLAMRVREKGLQVAERILDATGVPPYGSVQLENVLKAIELYNTFK
ncbi:MAG: hypothetical protein DBY32_04075 [Phascolarctobacterium sp.]|nr:MAG: hypothetical protein DBY32_04075 [Phascolarctobacterium sp.]